MSTCVMTPKVQNKSGIFVESILYNDLLNISDNDREFASNIYALSKEQNFQDLIKERAEYDVNGELTLETFVNNKVLTIKKDGKNVTVPEEKILTALNNRLGSHQTESVIEGVLSRVTEFNRNNPNGKYMATIVEEDNGDFRPIVVKKTFKQQKNLFNIVKYNGVKFRLAYILKSAGLNVEFLDGMTTTRVVDIKSGIDHIISNEDLNEITSDILLRLAEQTDLYKRFINSITPEVAKEVGVSIANPDAGPTFDEINKVAKILLVKANMNSDMLQTPYLSLASRVINFVKNKLKRIGNNKINNAVDEANTAAREIIESFLDPDFTAMLDRVGKNFAIEKEPSVNVKTFKNIVRILESQYREMKNIHQSKMEKYGMLLSQISSGRIVPGNRDDMFTQRIMIDGILEAVSLIKDTTTDIIEKLNNLDIEEVKNADDINAAKIQYARELNEIRAFIKHAGEISTIITNITRTDRPENKLSNIQPEETEKLIAMNKALSDIDNSLMANLMTKELEFFSDFCSETLGSNFITKAQRILFSFEKKPGYKRRIRVQNEQQVSISSMLETLESDDTMWERYLNSMSRSNDPINGIVDKAAKFANRQANREAFEIYTELETLRKNMQKDLGTTDTTMFYQISKKTGKRDGTYLSEYYWGDWEADLEEFKKTKKTEFLNIVDLKNKTDFEKAFLWDQFFRPQLKLWHKTHSKWDKDEEMYFPKGTQYINQDFIDNIKGTTKELYLDSFKALHNKMSEFLPDHNIKHYRVPQFKGRFIHQVKNRGLYEKWFTAGRKAVGRELHDTFVESADDMDFGSSSTFNNISEDMFHDDIQFEKEKFNRLPVFGINKLKNMDDLSTDLFQSLMAFGVMATKYYEMNQIVHTLEVGTNVLKNRKYKGSSEKEKIGKNTYAYSRYLKYLEAQVYGVGISGLNKAWKKTLLKLSRVATSVAAKLTIGGNVAGGIANLVQGVTEIMKESIAGEYFSTKDLMDAIPIYFASVPQNLTTEIGKNVKDDKVSQMRFYFNMKQSNDEKFRNFKGSKFARVSNLNPIGNNLFLPYEVGENFMQSITYITMLKKTKARVFDKETNSYRNLDSMWEAFKVVDAFDELSAKKIQLVGNVEYYNDETKKYEPWTDKVEANFADKIQEINNTLHGIYNKQDRTAFQQTIVGAMLLSMRGYALGMVNRRFSVGRYNVALGKETEGSMITFAKVMYMMFGGTDRQNLNTIAFSLLAPYAFTKGGSEERKKQLRKIGFSNNQIANLSRTKSDLMMVVIAILAKTLFLSLGKGDPDDPEDDDIGWGLAYYFASRLSMEQNAFTIPQGMINEAQTLGSITPVGISIPYRMALIGKQLIKGERYGETSKYAGQLKAWVSTQKLIPYWKSRVTVHENIYKASSSYQYGRTTLNKK